MATKDGGSAFPIVTEQAVGAPGMTLRDYFAAHALRGLLACDSWYLTDPATGNDITRDGEPIACNTPRGFAREAYILADAMLAAGSDG